MTEKFQDKYRISSARLRNWDYGWNGVYFITICTAGREHYFGEIVNDTVNTDVNYAVDGMIDGTPTVETPTVETPTVETPTVETQCIASLQQTPSQQISRQHISQQSPFPQPRLQPTEIGKIVESEWLKTPSLRPDMNLKLGEFVVMPNHFHAILIIGKNQYNHSDGTTSPSISSNRSNKNQFGPQRKNVASVIRSFKSVVTVNARKIHADFGWQTRFHDHIIHTDPEYHRIANYIENNPTNWEQDKFFRDKSI